MGLSSDRLKDLVKALENDESDIFLDWIVKEIKSIRVDYLKEKIIAILEDEIKGEKYEI